MTRTRIAAAPATQSEPVFMDIRRSATACQAGDKSGIIMVGDTSKITPETYAAHHADILDFNVYVGLFKP